MNVPKKSGVTSQVPQPTCGDTVPVLNLFWSKSSFYVWIYYLDRELFACLWVKDLDEVYWIEEVFWWKPVELLDNWTSSSSDQNLAKRKSSPNTTLAHCSTLAHSAQAHLHTSALLRSSLHAVISGSSPYTALLHCSLQCNVLYSCTHCDSCLRETTLHLFTTHGDSTTLTFGDIGKSAGNPQPVASQNQVEVSGGVN